MKFTITNVKITNKIPVDKTHLLSWMGSKHRELCKRCLAVLKDRLWLKKCFFLMVPKSVNILDINLCMCVCVCVCVCIKPLVAKMNIHGNLLFLICLGCLFLTYSQMECIIKWEECKKDYHHTMSEQCSRNGAVFRVIGDDLRTRTT